MLLFWVLITFCLYAYIGYPALLLLMSVLHRRPHSKQAGYSQSLSIIVAAYNEADVIQDKLNNLIQQNYPPEKLEIIVASDGSDDATDKIVADFAQREPRIKLLALPRRGKAYALNDAAAFATGEILVFSDANAMLEANTLCNLISNFYDPQVGGVAGNQHYVSNKRTGGTGLGEILYWRYDRWIKEMETEVGNAISADGALYAIRRCLYVPIKDPTVTDDFAISTRVVKQGYRLVYEPQAVVKEATTGSSKREFLRKARIINRGLRSLFGLGKFLYPWNGGIYSLQLVSHKLLRRLVPFTLPIIFITNVLLWPKGFLYRVILVIQSMVYGFGLAGFLLQKTRWGKTKIIYIPYYFCQANVAAILGVIWLVRGQRIALWQPQRKGE